MGIVFCVYNLPTMKRNILGLVSLTLVAVLISPSCKQAEDTVVEALLKSTAKQTNKKLPITVDSETRLDSVSIKPNRTMVYNYTLVNYSRTELDTTVLKNSMEPSMRKAIVNTAELKMFREKDVNFEYLYYDKNKKYAFGILIKASEYKQQSK